MIENYPDVNTPGEYDTYFTVKIQMVIFHRKYLYI